MKLSVLWRIMEIEEGVIRITPSEISLVLHMIRKPNSITDCFIIHSLKIIPSLKTYLKHASSYSWNEWNVRHFVSTTKTTQPRPQVFSVNGALTCKNAAFFWRHFLAKHKILPNLVISNWLWWIMGVPLANQNRANVLNE